jgi:hypothetical protein
MKNRNAVSGMLALGLLLATAVPRAQAQSVAKPLADTGIVSLGAGQVLRITVVSGAPTDAQVRFKRIEYFQGGCSTGTCALTVAVQSSPAAVTLRPNEGTSLEIAGGPAGVRATVSSETRGLRVNIQVIDANTNQIIAILIG